MAHCACINGHDMWNGDGKPEVTALREAFFLEYLKRHPDRVLGSDSCPQIYDCYEDDPDEEYDLWFCDDCQCLTAFTHDEHFRYDYQKVAVTTDITYEEVADWDKYYALRNKEFEDYMDFYRGKTPADAILQYSFPYEYRVSPDRKTIYAFDRNKICQYGFTLVRVLNLK